MKNAFDFLDIQKKLEELITLHYQPALMASYDPYRLLREMKDQQNLNEKALEYLRGRYFYSRESVVKPLENK